MTVPEGMDVDKAQMEPGIGRASSSLRGLAQKRFNAANQIAMSRGTSPGIADDLPMVLERFARNRQPFLDDKLGLPQGQGITLGRGGTVGPEIPHPGQWQDPVRACCADPDARRAGTGGARRPDPGAWFEHDS